MNGLPYIYEHAAEMLAPSLFELLIRECRGRAPIPVAVCWPCTEVALAGAIEAAESGIILPQLVGSASEIDRIADLAGLNASLYELVDVPTENDAARKSAELCRAGYAKALMKGSLHTDLMMQYVVAKDSGLRTSRRISHVFIMEAPLYRRPLLITDAAVSIQPTLEDKVDIVRNAIDLAHMLGNPKPKVAILSAIETVNSKIPSTLDAAALCKMADRDQITGAVLDGPLAFDTAVSRDAAAVKLLRSPVAGEADIVVVPDLESGNMLAKQLEYLGGARLAGIVLGAKIPIVLTSRADSAETRAASCAVASVLVHPQLSGSDVMKCANALCNAESLYFRSGSLHAIDVVIDETAAEEPVLKQKVVWLCERCTELFTIENWRPPGEQFRVLPTHARQPARVA